MTPMKKAIMQRILSGASDANIRFEDLRKVVIALGFYERVKGGHHIFTKDGIVEILNLQPLGDGKAKAYQVRQVRSIIVKYKLYKGGINVQI